MRGPGPVMGAAVALALFATTACTAHSSLTKANRLPGPERGGTLNLLGSGDVDYMDPNVSHYSVGYLALRLWTRQLFTYPANPGEPNTSVVPDLATEVPTRSNGGISADGLVYTIHLKKGVHWNTTPPRDVVAADVVRGVKRTCNPRQPFGGLQDYLTLIVGMQRFCDGFSKVNNSSSLRLSFYLESHEVSGVQVGAGAYTVVFRLTQPANQFPAILTLPAFSPAPLEWDQYLPSSMQVATHAISDGPYQMTSYLPGKRIVFTRNRAWNPATDQVRHAYVDNIVVNETVTPQRAQQLFEAGAPSADAPWDDTVPPARVGQLVASHDPRLTLNPTYATNPYIVFNEASPNNGGAMQKAAFRQALAYALNRDQLIPTLGGPTLDPPLHTVLPPGSFGYQPASVDYKHDLNKARALLRSSGATHVTLRFLVLSIHGVPLRPFLSRITRQLGSLGVRVVGVPIADYPNRTLQLPSAARRGVWDITDIGFSPDWYGDSAATWFDSLFASRAFPPTGENYSYYSNQQLDGLITRAEAQSRPSKAGRLWHQADELVMRDAVIYPITSPQQPLYHSAHAHNCVYVPALGSFDPTNIWLDSVGRSG